MQIENLHELFIKSSGVTTDTRKIEKDSIFFALKGANFNGNTFAEEALKLGAGYAVVDESIAISNERIIQVDNVLHCLQKLANYHRHTFKIPFIGITGSNGKTTTKELIATVLATKFKTHFTKGNFNNHIGVPLTLLSIPADTEIAVIEMGANHIGEIEALCEIADPDYGIITNIGKAHLEGFGSLEGVARGKSELFMHLLKNGGKAFVNSQNEHVSRMAQRLSDKILYLTDQSEYNYKFIDANPFLRLKTPSGIEINSQLVGAYNFDNIATALCIGSYFGVSESDGKRAIENYNPTNNRSQIIKKGTNTIVMDAYNANPSSMKVAIENLSKMVASSKVLIAGDMFELGEDSKMEHTKIIEQVEALNFEQALFCGQKFFESKKDLKEKGNFFETKIQLIDWLQKNDLKHSTILVKGSRGIGLETIEEFL